jgi:hypothetical protein
LLSGRSSVTERLIRDALHKESLISPCPVISFNDTMKLSSKQTKTIGAIFEEPMRSDVEWTDIETLLRGLGAELSEGRGSRIRVYLRGVRAVFHRPHPRKVTDKGALKSVRRFLTEAGIELLE